jgi:hypothetical protein
VNRETLQVVPGKERESALAVHDGLIRASKELVAAAKELIATSRRLIDKKCEPVAP